MPISDDTIRKIQALMDKAAEIVKKFPNMTQTEALLCANSTMTLEEIIKLKERAEKIDERIDAHEKKRAGFIIGTLDAVSHGWGVAKAEIKKLAE